MKSKELNEVIEVISSVLSSIESQLSAVDRAKLDRAITQLQQAKNKKEILEVLDKVAKWFFRGKSLWDMLDNDG